MFPKESWLEKLLKSKPPVYGHVPHIFYAGLTDPPLTRPNIWSEKKEEEEKEKIEIVGPKDYRYFVINTAVGVGAKGRNNIKSVHIRFRLIPMNEKIDEPEVVLIYPHSISEPAGQQQVIQDFKKELGLGVGVGSNANLFQGIANVSGSGKLKFDKSIKKIIDYTLPYHVVVANASGTGNRAVWEFYQEEGSAAIGQFDLKIYFRLPIKDIVGQKVMLSETSTA